MMYRMVYVVTSSTVPLRPSRRAHLNCQGRICKCGGPDHVLHRRCWPRSNEWMELQQEELLQVLLPVLLLLQLPCLLPRHIHPHRQRAFLGMPVDCYHHCHWRDPDMEGGIWTIRAS